MAKRLVKWTLAGSILRVADAGNEDDWREFRLEELFPEWSALTEAQQYVVVYGVKQCLADAGASDPEPTDKISSAFTRWEGILTGELRVQATAETKLEKAETALREAREKLELFRSLPPEHQVLANSLGVGEKALESAVKRAETALKKAKSETKS
jgi:hypothetical protein